MIEKTCSFNDLQGCDMKELYTGHIAPSVVQSENVSIQDRSATVVQEVERMDNANLWCIQSSRDQNMLNEINIPSNSEISNRLSNSSGEQSSTLLDGQSCQQSTDMDGNRSISLRKRRSAPEFKYKDDSHSSSNVSDEEDQCSDWEQEKTSKKNLISETSSLLPHIYEKDSKTGLYSISKKNSPTNATHMVELMKENKTNVNHVLNQCQKEYLPLELFVCPVCQKIFKSSLSFQDHEHTKCATVTQSVGNTKPLQFQCDICGKLFAMKNRLDNHKNTHIKLKSYKCESFVSPVCQKLFQSLISFQDHEQTKCVGKSRPLKFQCDICGKLFPGQEKLDDHRNTHTNAKPYKCTDCDKCFNSKNTRQFHYDAQHSTVSKDKRMLCSFCGITSTSIEHFKAHEKVHLLPEGAPVPEPFQCLQCGKRFISNFVLIRHRSKHKRSHKCSHCMQKYVSKKSLEKHMKSHTSNEEYKCELCSKTFARKVGLIQHRRNVHRLTSLQFFCDICDKGFKQKHHIEQHMITHSDERPISCPQCDETFKRKTHLKQHVAAFHDKKKNTKI